jgi:hypothetical protein
VDSVSPHPEKLKKKTHISISVKLQYLLRNLTLRFPMSGEESPSLPSTEVFLDVDLVGVAAPLGVGARSLGVKE